MVPFYGDFDTTETVYIPFNTFSSDDPSASVTITNLAAGDVEIHKDGSTTQRSSDSGVTVTIDFDSITGNHLVAIDLSDNDDDGYYAAGSRYQVRMEGTTVDGATVNAWIGSFSIGIINQQTTAALTALNLDHLAKTTTGVAADGDLTDYVADGTILSHIMTTGADTSDYKASTEALQSIRDKQTDIETDTNELQGDWTDDGRLDAILDGIAAVVPDNKPTVDADGHTESNVVEVSDSSSAATNMEIVFDTDFGTNYSTDNDKWQTEADVINIEGTDATDQIRDSVVDDANRIDATALNALTGISNLSALTIDAAGHLEVNVVEISDSADAANNAEIVFATDFATNYNTDNDKWQTEADVLTIEGGDATDEILGALTDDDTQIDATALNTLSGHDPGADLSAGYVVRGTCAYNAGALEVVAGLYKDGVIVNADDCTMEVYDFDGTSVIAHDAWDTAPTEHTGGDATLTWGAKLNDASQELSAGLAYYVRVQFNSAAFKQDFYFSTAASS